MPDTVKAGVIMRPDIIPFMNLGTDEEPQWEQCGEGWKKFSENPNAQTESTQYINQASETTDTVSYSPQYSIEIDLMYDEPTIKKVYDIAKNRLTGAEAVVDMCIVDSFRGKEEGKYYARRENLAVAINNIDGTKKMSMTGNLNCQGDGVSGTFELGTKTFTADGAAG